MLFKRRFLIACLAVSLLLRSAAGLAMQVDMAYAMAKSTVSEPLIPACHTDASVQTKHAADSAPASGNAVCELCCIVFALPSHLALDFSATAHTAPYAALFNNLPAAAQPPAKPPLV